MLNTAGGFDPPAFFNAPRGSSMSANSSRSEGPSHKAVEASVTGLIGLFGVLIIVGSLQAGINWGAEGPKAGFFPFYVGLVILVSSGINLVRTFADTKPEWIFA